MQKTDVEENLLRHMILNTLRMYNKKYKNTYGQLVIACDSSSWRRDYFNQYKYKRREARKEESTFDWNQFFSILNSLVNEIKENFPYKVMKIDKCEADDIIGVLVESTQEFGNYEPVMIISADKDFIQLQKYSNVHQFSPILKKEIKEKDPVRFLYEHIFKGDPGDGVPNILSSDNTFIEKIRQSPVTSKKMNEWIAHIDQLDKFMDSQTYRNFIRNKTLIDLSQVPEDIKKKILETYQSEPVAHKTRVLNYLIAKRCKLLIESVGDFL